MLDRVIKSVCVHICFKLLYSLHVFLLTPYQILFMSSDGDPLSTHTVVPQERMTPRDIASKNGRASEFDAAVRKA